MTTVVKWSGREARALRQARRMSVREFAAHLGVNDAAVSNWERRGREARLRYQTQQILDTDLAQASSDVLERFEVAIGGTPVSPMVMPSKDSQDQDGRGRQTLGRHSSTRTRRLLDAMRAQLGTDVPYLPPVGAAERMTNFLESSSRVFLVKGPPGSGKTRLTYHLSDELLDVASVQLLLIDSWELSNLDLAAEILRYASISRGDDPLLTLERECDSLSRPCLVIIDGIKAQEQLDRVGRHVDGILRQVLTDRLRFVLVVRTPPDIEVSSYPVLAASIFEPPSPPPRGASYVMEPWTSSDARSVWNRSRPAEGPNFDDLPPSAQQMLRLPLYMQLVKSAGIRDASSEVNPYRLIDHCVREIFRDSGRDPERLLEELADLAQREASGLAPSGTAILAHRDPQTLR